MEESATAASGSAQSDKLTREYKMTLDEARLILNVKPGIEIEALEAVSPSSPICSIY